MLRKKKLKYFLAIALSFVLIDSIKVENPVNHQNIFVRIGNDAQAKSTGGRSRGGSFKKRSSNSNSRSSSSSSKKKTSNSTTRNSGSSVQKQPSNSTTRNSNSSVQKQPFKSNSNNSVTNNYRSGSNIPNPIPFIPVVIFLCVFSVVILLILKSLNSTSGNTNKISKVEKERDNDIVTVSKVQVALFAEATEVQSELLKLSLRVDTQTDEGLLELFQESILVLLRHSEQWSHILNTSKYIHIDEAEQVFKQFSFAERSKFTQETLTNVNGNISQKQVVGSNELAAYIVVTLLVGTAHDKPLFDKIRTIEELKAALEKLASIRSDYLMTFELLWSPESETDSLTYDELLTEYTDMIQMV